MKVQMTGGAVVSLVGLVAVAYGVYVIRKKGNQLANAVGNVIDTINPVNIAKKIDSAVPPTVTVTRPNGTNATVSGADIKKYNANGSNMGVGVGGWGIPSGSSQGNDYPDYVYADPFGNSTSMASVPFDLDYNFGVKDSETGSW